MATEHPPNISRRSTVASSQGVWYDLEGAIVARAGPQEGKELPIVSDVAVFLFGVPLLRARARYLPRDH